MVIVIFHTDKKVINYTLDPQHVEQVCAAFPGAEVYTAEDGADLLRRGVKANIVIGWGNTDYIDEAYCMACADTLQWVHCLSAGVEGILSSPIPRIPGIRITNSSGIHGGPIAEHVLGYLLGHYRGLEQIRTNQRQGVWERFICDELSGKTVLVVGLGSIGKTIAQRCRAFGCTVHGVKRRVEECPGVDRVFANDRLDEALPSADVVVSVLPHTPQTEGLFDAALFARFKPGAVFVNVGRGKTVDTDALVDALRAGAPAAAMLDAIEPEPLPAGHPLWGMEQVLISPHISAESQFYFQRAFARFQVNAALFAKGLPMETQIDLATEGY